MMQLLSIHKFTIQLCRQLWEFNCCCYLRHIKWQLQVSTLKTFDWDLANKSCEANFGVKMNAGWVLSCEFK